MVENRSTIFGIITLIIGASGLGLGAFSAINFQILEGPEGPPGDDGQDGIDGLDGVDGTDGIDGINGTDGQDSLGGIVVVILDPDQGETISGNVIVRVLVACSENYTAIVLINGSLDATQVPFEWNTTEVADGWWNVTVIVTDVKTNNVSQDEVIIYVSNTKYSNPFVGVLNPDMGEIVSGIVEIKALVYGTDSYSISIRRNSTEIATTVPYDWDTTLEIDKKWYNITVIITDIATNNVSQDEVIVYVKNAADPVVIKSRVRGYLSSSSSMINWNAESYDANSDFDLSSDRFYAPRTGYYRVYAHLHATLLDGSGAYYVGWWFFIGGTISAYTQEWPTHTEWCVQLSSTFFLTARQYIIIAAGNNDPMGVSYLGGASTTYFTIEEL